MKYKVVTLIMLIPLVLMVCVFSAANFTSLQVPIAVSGVSLYHEKLEVVNLAENSEFKINAQVKPINASNKGLIYKTESVSGKPMPNLTIDKDGTITASGYGTAKVIVETKDGAYKKSFILFVTSTVATELVAELSTTEELFVGDNFQILASVMPSEALNKDVRFSSTDNNIVRIDELTGQCQALSSGRVTLKASLQDGLNGKLEKTFDVVIMPNTSSNPITFNGLHVLNDNIFAENFSSLMEVNFSDLHNIGFTLSKEDIVLDYDNDKVESVEFTEISNSNGIYKYNVEIRGIKADEFDLTAKLDFENYSSYSSSISLNKIVNLTDLEVNLTNFKEYIKQNATNNFKVEVLPKDFTGYVVDVYFEDGKITLAKNGNDYYYQGLSECVDTLNIKISYEDEVIKTISKRVEVLNPPMALEFAINPSEYGIEELPTFGNEKIVLGEYQNKNTTFDFATTVNLEDIEFESSDEGIAKFVDGEMVILNEGKVTIKALEKKSKLLGVDLSCELIIRCIKGVEVETYQDLVQATEDGKQVVLTQDIMLGTKLINVNGDGTKTQLFSDAQSASILNEEVKQIETTSEWNYYKYAKGYQTPPTVNYIIKFTNNVFGNGHYINADNISNMVDGSGSLYPFAVFRGPKSLVELPEAKVMAQDNICFIATDNVMINNVELIGANLGGLTTTDLTALDYVGTVLEVMGDNVKIVNSKIKNGRTCVRVYGKESGNFDKINVLIESCEISYAREFLIKMGTNKKLYGDYADRAKYNLADSTLPASVWEDCAPKIENYHHLNDATLSMEEYNSLVEQYKQDDNFQNLVNTNLTVKNCVLYTSGLFSIGLESSFAGPALDGARYGNNYNFEELGWLDIAGTSYPTQLNLEGDVKIYDWKKIENIDSSKLIEGSLLSFDIAKMLKTEYDQGKFTDIINTDGNSEYAHGGIVMYGGGKNYCLINNNMTDKDEYLNFTINLDSLQSGASNSVEAQLLKLIKYASGKEDFRFFMCGKDNYYKQITDFENGDAYKYLGKYDF